MNSMEKNKNHAPADGGPLAVSGRCWVFGDDVDTDQILPGYAMAEPADTLGRFAMAGSAVPDFASQVREGDILVAGENFGCGSSREQAPVALVQAGVRLVIASSFARIFRRNAINIGLPVLVADMAGHARTGETLSADVAGAAITLGEQTYTGRALSESSLATLRAGGLINRVRLELSGKARTAGGGRKQGPPDSKETSA